MNGIRPSYGGSGNCNNCAVRDRSGVTARANITESLVIQKASMSAGSDGRLSVENTGSVVPGSSSSCSMLSIHVLNKKDNEDSLPVCLKAKPVERAAGDMIVVRSAFSTKESKVRCTRGTETLWSDRVSGKVTVLAGNVNFWAIGCEDVCLQGIKKHKLLREDILPSMASNRNVQRLLNEFMDLLSEYEAVETKDDSMDVMPQTATEANATVNTS